VPILHVPSRIAAAVVAARATRAASFGCGVAASLSICWWWCTRHCCDERRFCWTTNLGKCLIYVYFSCIEYKVLWDFVREPSPSTIPCCLGRCFYSRMDASWFSRTKRESLSNENGRNECVTILQRAFFRGFIISLLL
jgi:hypothetical protein